MKNIKKFPKLDGEIGWFETAPDHKDWIGQRLKGVHECDIVIVGGGYTGLSTAHRLAQLQPDAKIAVIDALRIGEGTSGRNAGFIINIPHNVDGGVPNKDDDLMVATLNQFAISWLQNLKDRSLLECGWHNAGKFMAAHESRNLSGLDDFVRLLKNAGFAYEDCDSAETKKRLGTAYYQRSIYTPGNILMNPAALIRIVAHALPKNVSLFEASPVISCDYGVPHQLYTLGGQIKAKTIILATNSFNEQFGQLSNRLATVFTYASMTRRLTVNEVEDNFANIAPWGVTSAHGAGTTVRYTPDQRIFVRNVLEFSTSLQASNRDLERAWQQHRLSYERRFPALKQVDFEYTWGGMIAVTMNHDSIIKQTAPDVYVLNGCNGVGVPKGVYLGYYAAEMICGNDSLELQFLLKHNKPTWLPPEPFKSIGANIRLRYEQYRAGGDV